MGELRTLWVDGFKPKSTCGCGQLIRSCEIWQAIFERAFGGIDNMDLAAINQLRKTHEPRSQKLFKLLLLPKQKPKSISSSKDYLTILKTLYQAIQEICHSQAIVDDSLHPGYAYMLSAVASFEVYLVHLVRDARGCAYSWTKRQKRGLGSYSLRDSSLGWNLRNLAVEVLRRDESIHYHQIRYEDFVSNPQETIENLVQFVGAVPKSLPFVSTSEVNLGVSHSVFGNDNRTETGIVALRLDEAWKRQMKRPDKLKVTALTWPLLLRYGYL